MKKLLTVSEVADFLDVSESTVCGLIKRGELAGTRIASSIRVKESDLEAYINQPAESKAKSPDVVIVTRHKGAVEWLKRRGISGPTFDRVRRSDIRDKIVYGVIPLPMARFARKVYIIDMPYADQEYEEMTAEDMDQAGAHLVALTVSVSQDRAQ